MSGLTQRRYSGTAVGLARAADAGSRMLQAPSQQAQLGILEANSAVRPQVSQLSIWITTKLHYYSSFLTGVALFSFVIENVELMNT